MPRRLALIALAGAVVSVPAAPSSGASRYRTVAGVIGVIAMFTIITSVGVCSGGGGQHWIEFGAGVAAISLASLAGGRHVSRLVESTGLEARSEMPDALRAAASRTRSRPKQATVRHPGGRHFPESALAQCGEALSPCCVTHRPPHRLIRHEKPAEGFPAAPEHPPAAPDRPHAGRRGVGTAPSGGR